tara:strand:- start:4991 stop:5689 length:699 start_codon:yes stop_codon:yes gene_type:complete
MGMKDNFKSALNKAIEGKDKMMYKSILKNAHNLEEEKNMKTHEGKSCKEVHPKMSHKKWGETKESEMEEATTAASAGAYVGPLTTTVKKAKKNKEEFEEATTASSSGSYETPQMWAKDEKNWRGKAKTTWPGGKFVKIKDKCKTFPYCNQGDINALELTENKKIKKAIQEVSKKTGKDKKYIKELVRNELEEIISRSFYKSPITSILGPETKMDKPIGKIYSMGSNVGAKYE